MIDKNKLWQLARDIYNDDIPDKVFINGLTGFSWDECNQWLVSAMAKDIAKRGTINSLAKLLNKDEKSTIEWYDDFLYFLSSSDSTLLDIYPVMPSQSHRLRMKSELSKDGGIPEELKEISRLLGGFQEWNDLLLIRQQDFPRSQKLIQSIADISQIARQIDDAIRGYSSEEKQTDNFREIVNKLLDWGEKNQTEFKKNLPYFYEHRSELFLLSCGSNEVRENIFHVLQTNHEKLNALAEVAKEKNIDEQDLKNLLANKNEYQNIQKLKKSTSKDETIQLLNELGINWQMLVSSQSIPFANESEIIYIDDAVSDPDLAEKYGEMGEGCAVKFYTQLGYKVSKSLADLSYDLDCLKGDESLKIEVKTISFYRPYIRFTPKEWNQMKLSGESYEILIILHEQGSLRNLIRVQQAWFTLQDALSRVNHQKVKSSYGSQEIEPLLGLQLNQNNQNNDVILSWKHLFYVCENDLVSRYSSESHPDIFLKIQSYG